ncbi:MAG: mechanosensitive ion channel family protein [Myxococcota bacterium]
MQDPRLIASVLASLIVLVLGVVARGAIGRMDLTPVQRRRTKNMVFYVAMVVFGIALAVVWADVVQSAAIVASGFAVAIVLFNKDLILSILGWWMKIVSGAYRIGDRIRVGDVRGDVIDYGLLTTTLMQVETEADHGMRTGNVVTFPNALLLTEPVLNETRTLQFEWKEIAYVLPKDADWRSAEEHMQRAALTIVAEYREVLESQLVQMSDRFAFHAIQGEPHIFVKPLDDGRIRLWVRIALPARQIAILADRLNRAFLEWLEAPTEV